MKNFDKKTKQNVLWGGIAVVMLCVVAYFFGVFGGITAYTSDTLVVLLHDNSLNLNNPAEIYVDNVRFDGAFTHLGEYHTDVNRNWGFWHEGCYDFKVTHPYNPSNDFTGRFYFPASPPDINALKTRYVTLAVSPETKTFSVDFGYGTDYNKDALDVECGLNCGNLVCDSGETIVNCPMDCRTPNTCGNKLCEAGETYKSCSVDCPYSVCGNSWCESGEDIVNCIEDCGIQPPLFCGDNKCTGSETYLTCLVDCPIPIVCGDGVCNGNETTASCLSDCPNTNTCGNNVCDNGETTSNCPADCSTPNLCGNSVCNTGETTASCPSDCGGFDLIVFLMKNLTYIVITLLLIIMIITIYFIRKKRK